MRVYHLIWVYITTYMCTIAIPAYVLCSTSKVSLKRYRDASFEVMAVLMQHVASESFERASIDEAYMDLTHQVSTSS